MNNILVSIHSKKSIIKTFVYCNLFIFSSYAYKKFFEKEREMLISSKEENKDEFPDDCSLHPNQYRLLTYTSCIPAFVSIYGFKRGYWDLASFSLGASITSVLYWTKPDYSWRRTLDVNFIRAAMLYHCLRGYNAEKGRIYFLINGFIIVLYVTESQFYLNKKYWLFTYAHILLHILGKTQNFILYTGHIPRLTI